jgi:hypothetical protein
LSGPLQLASFNTQYSSSSLSLSRHFRISSLPTLNNACCDYSPIFTNSIRKRTPLQNTTKTSRLFSNALQSCPLSPTAYNLAYWRIAMVMVAFLTLPSPLSLSLGSYLPSVLRGRFATSFGPILTIAIVAASSVKDVPRSLKLQ